MTQRSSEMPCKHGRDFFLPNRILEWNRECWDWTNIIWDVWGKELKSEKKGIKVDQGVISKGRQGLKGVKGIRYV